MRPIVSRIECGGAGLPLPLGEGRGEGVWKERKTISRSLPLTLTLSWGERGPRSHRLVSRIGLNCFSTGLLILSIYSDRISSIMIGVVIVCRPHRLLVDQCPT
jgi:hypothetical protein